MNPKERMHSAGNIPHGESLSVFSNLAGHTWAQLGSGIVFLGNSWTNAVSAEGHWVLLCVFQGPK